jgi:hypothetical protein
MWNKLLKLSLLLVFFSAATASSHALELTKYKFRWLQPETKLELKMFLAPVSMLGRVGEQGEYLPGKNLPILRELPGDSLEAPAGENNVLYLVAKNPGKKTVKFYVAPHHIDPPSASLGFNFQCLCNSHIYTVKPGKLWYRIMLLKTADDQSAKTVTLTHKLILKKD